ncbi:MAG: TIGR03768 family metallophosphoesterase [Firmicutes bacterium]|nr:TIGR03768 family metallophosphoesterase [Bacillota bacterium]
MKLSYGFKKICLFLMMGAMTFIPAGCSSDSGESAGPTYPISSVVKTTRERTVVPDPVPTGAPVLKPYQVEEYSANGYGKWHFGEGMDAGKQTDIMPDGYDASTVTNTATLLNFFTMSDVHICDKESPAQSILFGYSGGSSAAYSPVKLYTTQVLDAAVQTINALHEKTPFDFGIDMGDDCDNTQYNEVRWFVDVMDGKLITPSSGNHAGATTIDYQKPYQAAGLNREISWYQTVGNHDHFWQGGFPINDYIRKILLGKNIINIAINPVSFATGGYYLGAIDGSTPFGDIFGMGPESDFATPPQVDAADPDRRSLTRNEWISEFFNTTTTPAGHGFSQENVKTGFACYSFEPKSNIPVKVIVLDDTMPESISADNYSFGYLDEERFQWLVNELDEGQKNGKLMIVTSHCPINVVVPAGQPSMWSTVSPVSEATLLAKLHTYSNLILWLAGHRHNNCVTVQPSTDAAHPEYSFWEVETASLRDFPQTFRTINIVRNSDNNISIIITNVDPAVADGSPAATSRSYGIAAQEMFKNQISYLPVGIYNAELMKQLSPEMQKKIQNYGTLIK